MIFKTHKKRINLFIFSDIEKRLCEKDLSNLKKWTYNLTADLDNALTFQGHDDLLFLAKRMRSKFPILNDAAGFSPEMIQKHFAVNTYPKFLILSKNMIIPTYLQN